MTTSAIGVYSIGPLSERDAIDAQVDGYDSRRALFIDTDNRVIWMLDDSASPVEWVRLNPSLTGSAVHVGTCNGRLTTESGVPVSTSDRTAQSTIYFTPYSGNQIALYDGVDWQLVTFPELSLALSSLTSDQNHDVFVDYNGGTPQLVLSAAWTNDTTRADALTLQDGVYVKSGATDHRYVGTIRTTSTTTTEDSGGGVTTQVGGRRFVWNLYNRVYRSLSVFDATDQWSYTNTTIRQANGAAGNKVEFVVGLDISPIDVGVVGTVDVALNTVGGGGSVGVGVDSTTAFSGRRGWAYNSLSGNHLYPLVARHIYYSGIGYHYAAWLERGSASGICVFYGDGGGTVVSTGLTAELLN